MVLTVHVEIKKGTKKRTWGRKRWKNCIYRNKTIGEKNQTYTECEPENPLNPCWCCWMIIHRQTWRMGCKCLTWLHSNPLQVGGGSAKLEIVRRGEEKTWWRKQRLQSLPGNIKILAHMNIHLCHTTTLLLFSHAPCEEEELTFHCLHNLKWPMEWDNMEM